VEARQFTIIILMLSFVFPIAETNQHLTALGTVTVSSTSASYVTYTQGITQFSSTGTTAIYQGNLQLSAWGIPGCAADFPFTALPGDWISVTFESNVPIDFHIISAGPKYHGIVDVFCGFGVPPGSLQEVSYRTSSSVQWTTSEEYYRINQVTQYFLVIDNWQAAPVSVSFSSQVTSSQMVTSTLLATSTFLSTILSTQTYNNPTSPTSATSLSSTQTAQNPQQFVLLSIIPVVLILALLWRRRRKHVERTQVY